MTSSATKQILVLRAIEAFESELALVAHDHPVYRSLPEQKRPLEHHPDPLPPNQPTLLTNPICGLPKIEPRRITDNHINIDNDKNNDRETS